MRTGVSGSVHLRPGDDDDDDDDDEEKMTMMLKYI